MEFKIGDRVRIGQVFDGYLSTYNNRLGIVVSIVDHINFPYCVKMDDFKDESIFKGSELVLVNRKLMKRRTWI